MQNLKAKCKAIIKLLRVKHYIKNCLVFLPLFFTGKDINLARISAVLLGTIAFCLASSFVYVINDIKDRKKDCLHPTKCNRPIASKIISVKQGIFIAILCLCASFAIAIFLTLSKNAKLHTNAFAIFYLLTYIILNIAYSLCLKNFAIIDIAILASGFVLRVLFGACLANTYVSAWLYLTIVAGAFYFGLCKRRGEIKTNDGKATRDVLFKYSLEFLDKFMYVCLAMACVFYALWAKEYPKPQMIWTVPLVIIICMQYCLDVEGNSDGDPVEVLLRDKKLIAFCIIFVLALFGVIWL